MSNVLAVPVPSRDGAAFIDRFRQGTIGGARRIERFYRTVRRPHKPMIRTVPEIETRDRALLVDAERFARAGAWRVEVGNRAVGRPHESVVGGAARGVESRDPA